MKRFGIFAAVVAVAMTASCSTSTDEEPGAAKGTAVEEATNAQEEPLTAEAALGDLSTVDFCGLLDTKALEEGIEGTLAFTQPGFSQCLVGIDTQGGRVIATIGNLYDKSESTNWPSEDETLSRSVHRQVIATEVGCVRALLFADEIGLEVFAWELEDAGKLDTETICHIADAVTDGVQDAALSEDTFTLSFQPGSLAELEPCSLLEDTEAAKVLGGETSAQEQLGGHGCTWEVSSGESTGATAELTFDVALTADLSGFSGEIAGRPTQMSVDGYMCQVATPHIPFSQENPNQREVVTLLAMATWEDPCQAVEELAEVVWPQLPKFPG
ncbi:hypothetical protein [Saccharomonospora viridis]|jgi:hypothetical protein|uniref:hypothetical protein n=1 Tax=Saccharomonospora viridis TaxID=1852 RepID=UPI0024A9D085|nr:hypothetical protein [Saccharomonospora viridis]